MHCEIVKGLQGKELDTVWSWFNDLPAFVRKQMERDAETKEQFERGFDENDIALVYDGDLLGAVVLEQQDGNIYEGHLFCPRRIPTDKLREAIATFFDAINAQNAINTIVFKVRRCQGRLGQILMTFGCEYSGWRFREHGQEFYIVVHKKIVAKSANFA